MTRRKSVCLKWTLVLILVVICPYVYSRPQESSQAVSNSSTSSLDIGKPTEDPIRYRHRHNVDLYNNDTFNFSFVHIPDNTNFTNHSIRIAKITSIGNLLPAKYDLKTNNSDLLLYRLSRVLRHKYKNRVQNDTKPKLSNNKNYSTTPNKNDKNTNTGFSKMPAKTKDKHKPVIKKVITKWTDNAKYDDLDFGFETTTSEENDATNHHNSFNPTRYNTENNIEESVELTDKRIPDKRYRPRPQYSEESQIYTSDIQIVDNFPFSSTRPPYVFNTPTPTPIITNVGYPQPWPQYQQRPIYEIEQSRPTTQKPIKTAKPLKAPYNYHNMIQNNYPQYPSFEVTTFPPTTAYTDRIVIRPEEYSASPDECPTIFLTLNNTFQGQGKEACPDLNIAVNTNVINKNVVIESEEENDPSFTDVFGVPLGDESESEETPQEYFDSAENQEEAESASIEGNELTNYNAANVAESSESYGPPSAALSEINRPSRPSRPSDSDDDSFGLSSILSFFQPALNAFAWLATINPLSFGLLSLILSPIVLLVAGTSGIATLIAPWAFSYGREAPKISVYRPQWEWDDEDKTWQLNSFPERQWYPTSPRSNENYSMRSSFKPTWFYRLKELMKAATETLKAAHKNDSMQNTHKNRSKKRETWMIRVK